MYVRRSHLVLGLVDVDGTDDGERLLRLVVERPRLVHLRLQPEPDAAVFTLEGGRDAPTTPPPP